MASSSQLNPKFDSYHPHGVDQSVGLARARKPFRTANLLVGGGLALFAVGVYAYSISAVKQDDFSDVADLLPPLEERAKIRSIEDEARDKLLGSAPAAGPSSSTPSPVLTTTSSGSSSWLRLPGRLSDVAWVKARGWVEQERGNVLVWGAPPVDSIGRIGDSLTPGLKGRSPGIQKSVWSGGPVAVHNLH